MKTRFNENEKKHWETLVDKMPFAGLNEVMKRYSRRTSESKTEVCVKPEQEAEFRAWLRDEWCEDYSYMSLLYSIIKSVSKKYNCYVEIVQ